MENVTGNPRFPSMELYKAKNHVHLILLATTLALPWVLLALWTFALDPSCLMVALSSLSSSGLAILPSAANSSHLLSLLLILLALWTFALNPCLMVAFSSLGSSGLVIRSFPLPPVLLTWWLLSLLLVLLAWWTLPLLLGHLTQILHNQGLRGMATQARQTGEQNFKTSDCIHIQFARGLWLLKVMHNIMHGQCYCHLASRQIPQDECLQKYEAARKKQQGPDSEWQ